MTENYYSSIEEIHQLYMQKKLTVRDLVFTYLSRIAKIDSCAEGLHSVLEINPDALFIADAMDDKLKKAEPLTPLFGIPVFLKDNINTKDRLHTSAGSLALADNYAPYDANIVKDLRNAGALILGKVNMTEFANYMTREGMPSGYSSRGGQVINPHNRDKNPSGSSSGSAVAVAAGLCAVSIGTETSGSIIAPAMDNGIVGIKPTLGLVARSGIIPISSTFDTAGPMTRTVRDAAMLLNVITGYDPDDAATHAHNSTSPKDYSRYDYTQYLDRSGLRGMKIGINRAQRLYKSEAPEEEKAAFDNLCKVITDAGAILIDNITIENNSPCVITIMRHEFKACMNYYLSTLGESTSVKTLKDIVEYNQSHAKTCLKYGQSILLDTQNNTSGTMTEPAYLEAL
jgi:amidase